MELAAEIELHPLVEKCKQGDTRSYSELYRQYSRAMFSTCYRLLNNIADAEDILQESFTDAFRHLHNFEYKSSFGAWLKQIVVNKCVNHLRQKKMVLVDLEKSTISHLPDDDPEDEEKIFLQVAAIKRAVQELPTGYRTVLCLYLLEGYDHDEIADILGVASSTTRTQYKRAKEKLLQILKEGGRS